jgi:hypothetical protein
MYSIYDSVAQAFRNPWYMHNDGEALRVFEQIVNDKSNKDNLVAQHPEQFTLFHIGEWDDKNATIESFTPKSIGLGVEYVDANPEFDKLDKIIEMLQQYNVTPIKEAK